MKINNIRPFVYIVCVIVAVAVIAGFFIVGSPKEERLRRFDNQRIQDLQTIQNQIVSFWQAKQKLPKNLNELTDSISGFVAPKDPETNSAYGYEEKGELSFTICVTFSRAGSGSPEGVYPASHPASYDYPVKVPFSREQQNWDHASGYVCFDKTIDEDIYEVPVR